jgi:hypothetical protein
MIRCSPKPSTARLFHAGRGPVPSTICALYRRSCILNLHVHPTSRRNPLPNAPRLSSGSSQNRGPPCIPPKPYPRKFQNPRKPPPVTQPPRGPTTPQPSSLTLSRQKDNTGGLASETRFRALRDATVGVPTCPRT